jgi:hypothetical protein
MSFKLRKHDRIIDGIKLWVHPVHLNYAVDSDHNLYAIKNDKLHPKKWNFRKIDGRYATYNYSFNTKYISRGRFLFETIHNVEVKPGFVVDHINNISTDDRIENLQAILSTENNKKCVFSCLRTKEKHVYRTPHNDNFVKMKIFVKDDTDLETCAKIRDSILKFLNDNYSNIEVY